MFVYVHFLNAFLTCGPWIPVLRYRLPGKRNTGAKEKNETIFLHSDIKHGQQICEKTGNPVTLLDHDQLLTFVAICETGSHANAALRVNKSQSAVSMQMKRLEERVGKPLFQRVGRSNQLTPEGELLLEHAQRIIALNERALAALTQPELEGRIRVGAPDDYAEQFLPAILSRFSQTHSRVEVEVVCEISAELARRIAADRLDLAIVNKELIKGDMKGELLRIEPLHWVTSPGHKTHEEPVLPLAVVPDDCSWRKAAENALESIGRPYRIAYKSASTLGMNVAVEAGLAVGVMPKSAFCPGDLRILSQEDGFPPLPRAEIALIHGKKIKQPHIRAMADYIISSLTNLPDTEKANSDRPLTVSSD